MSRSEYRKLLWGAGLLGGSALLAELLTFRLVAAAIGHGFAMFGSITAPAAAAFGALVLARRSGKRTGHELDRTAAHATALAGTFAVLAVIALTLVSQKIARAQGAGETWHVVLGLASCWLPAMCGGAALAVVMRRGARHIGRVSSVAALGAVVGCLAAPWLMDFGAPRAAIVNGLPYGVAALLFASSGKPAKPKTAMVWTLPLAVVALLAGDVGAPWLKMRFDLGRRSRIDHTMWSPQGLVAVQKVKRDRTSLHVDRGLPVALAEKPKATRKPAFQPQDLVYLTSEGEPGPVLVVGSAGGREVAVALAYEHPRIDVVELHQSFVNEVLLDRYATVTGHVLQREGVTAQIGDGRAALLRMPRDYQHVVVQARGTFDQAAPRLLSRHDRLYTREAIAAYLDRLRDGGSLLVRAPKAGLPSLVVAASAALGQDPGMARDHLLACSDEDDAVLLVQLEPMAPSQLYNLEKRCKRSRLEVEYPLKETRSLRDRKAAEKEREARLAVLEAGRAATDDVPFFEETPSLGELRRAAWSSLRALEPAAEDGDATKKSKAPQDPDDAEREAAGPDALPEMSSVGTAAAALGVALLLVFVGLLVPPPRARERGAEAAAGAPGALRGSFVLFGVAMAVSFFVVDDALLRVLGDAAYAWPFVIPLGLVGVAAGRLWVEVVAPERLRRATSVGLAVGLGWLALLAGSHGTLLGWVETGLTFRLTASMFVLVVTGWQLGWPLAAGLKTVAVWDRAAMPWAWGAHMGGWALGGALSATLAPFTGIAGLGWLGVVAFALGAIAMVLGQRKDPAGGWVVRPAPTVPEVAPPSSSPLLGH